MSEMTKIESDINRLENEHPIEEEKYYNSVTKDYSEDDWKRLLKMVGLTNYTARVVFEKDEKDKETGKYRVKFYYGESTKEECEFLQVFQGEYLDRLCTQKNIPRYTDIIEDGFSFTFEKHEFRAFLMPYPKTFFNGYEYHKDDCGFYYNGQKYDMKDIIVSKLANLQKSSLNKHHLKITSNRNYTEAIDEFYQDMLGSDKCPESFAENLGTYEKVKEIGKEFNENNGIKGIGDWYNIINLVCKIGEDSFRSLAFFTIANIKLRLYGDTTYMRTLVLWGDGGVGKDTTLPSLVMGIWLDSHREKVWGNSSVGVTGFSSSTPRQILGYVLQVISDDIKGANDSARFDMITNPIMKIENKGKDSVNVRKRCLQMLTNNNPRIFFAKLDDSNIDAYARRILISEVRNVSKNTTAQKKYYEEVHHFFEEPDHQCFFAGFWYSCFLECENSELLNDYNNRCLNKTRDMAQGMTNQNNDDRIIITEFKRQCADARFDDNGNLIDGSVAKKSIKNEDWYVTKSHIPLFVALKHKFGDNAIKNALKTEYGDKFKFDKVIKYGDKSKKCWAVPCSVVDAEEEVRQNEDVNSEENRKNAPTIDIVANLKKYFWFPDNKPTSDWANPKDKDDFKALPSDTEDFGQLLDEIEK